MTPPDGTPEPTSGGAPSTARAREAQRAEAARAARTNGSKTAGGPASGKPAKKGKKNKKGEEKSSADSALELVVILAVALGLALGIQAFLVKPYSIPSESMVPTLQIGQRVLVNRIGNRFSDPSVGDIVVFHPPASATDDNGGGAVDGSMCAVKPAAGQACPKEVSGRSDQNFIKRVVAGPGDTIAIKDEHVYLNGKLQKEPFAQTRCADGSPPPDFPTPVKIPADHWYMMGDNRECSEDSRFWGPVPKKWIIGGAFATYWPPKRIGFL